MNNQFRNHPKRHNQPPDSFPAQSQTISTTTPDIPGAADAKSSGLRLLFVHQNFPSPYVNLAAHYAADANNVVAAIGDASNLKDCLTVPGVLLFGYPTAKVRGAAVLPLIRDFEDCVRRGKAAQAVMEQLKGGGFVPDVIIGDPVWGELLFIRNVFPDVPVLARAEAYCTVPTPLANFDPESPYKADDLDTILAGQAAALRGWADAQALYSATRFQADTFPPLLRAGITVMHEGIRSDVYKPAPARTLPLPPTDQVVRPDNHPLPSYVPRRREKLDIGPEMDVFVFFSRVLEPHRGWHTFIRALPAIQKRHPEAHCLIVGRTRGGYGPPPRPPRHSGRLWRDIFLNEVRGDIDFAKTHFLGNVSTEATLAIMQRAKAFVSLTCPSFPSWSPLEAMACGAPLVTSDVPPMRELAGSGENALFVDFFDSSGLADAVCRLLEDEPLRRRLGENGRRHVVEQYDFEQVCLPRWEQAINALIHTSKN